VEPGSAHGYHGITIGIIVTELIRRTTGTTFADFYRQRVQERLGKDLYFGVDNDGSALSARVVDVTDPLLAPGEMLRSAALEPEPDSMVALSVNQLG
jgi:CubicO group peptidase (beta-lactamase class C family)